MEIVVLRSDIARLVLGYLKNEQLVRASHVFCKTSPHLRQEFSAYKQGLQTYSFFPDLEEIICEYVKITRKVDQLLPGLPNTCRAQLQHRKLSDKVAELLERTVQTETYLGSSVRGGAANQANSSAGKGSVQSDKENNAKRRSELQGKRKNDSLLDSPDEQRKSTSTVHVKKRRRVLEPFCYLGSKSKKRKKETELSISYSSADDLTHSDENCEDDEFEEEEATSEAENEHDVDDISLMEKPTKESTPRNKVAQHSTPPSLPEMSQAILDNPEFQLKLVQNINQALLTTTSHSNLFNAANFNQNAQPPNAEHPAALAPVATELNDEQNIITSNQLLDQMVKNILEATEKDPTFDAIIEEVIGASNKSLVSAAAQCDMGEAASVVSGYATSGGTEVHNSEAVPPSTPLVIRTAVEAANVASAAPNATLTANTSFGSLIDPNFSISKLIVLNSNDSAQKQPPEQNIGNTTADQLINQLTSSNADCAMDDQVYFDPTTGQLTFPLFLTNDGLLTNFPFLINNEVVTQQLQPSNVANLEASRIEIPLAEPIVVSADQLPPNSIILGSAQKVGGDLEQQLPPSTLLKTETGASTAIFSAVPSSLDSRIHIGRATPSGSGIFNGKAYRSLSTPRKRASHVRTLTFSPRSTVAPITLVGATPLSTRKQSLSRLRRVPENIPETSAKPEVLVPEKPIIKKVEVLPPIAAVKIEASCNESSNSCSVPPLFGSEESSNLTVIKGICCDKDVPPISKVDRKESQVFNADTPKRKQPRCTAVRACKRQLSKSSNEDELEGDQQGIEEVNAKGIKIIAPTATSNENQGNTGSCLQQDQETLVEHIKEKEDKLLQEWQRMRSATSSDLDTRLRELNAKMVHSRPQKKEIKKKVRRKKAVDRKKKNSHANASVVEADIAEEAVHNIEREKDTMPVVVEVCKIKMERKTKACAASSAEEKQRQKKEKKKQIKEKPKEFSVKIPTPQKSTNEKLKPKHNGAKGNNDTPGNEPILIASAKPTADVEQPTAKADHEGFAMELGLNTQRVFQMPAEQSLQNLTGQALTQGRQTAPHEDFECEKRTANIACLLDTPFKDVNTMVPPTPGVLAPSLDTPLSKVRPSLEHEAMHSSSFLFGSLTKSELNTPMLSAITPGFRFTPFGSRDATPRSVTATEYSSGGSYYRPDESDDLDKNIDRLLRDSTQKKQEEPRQPQQFDEQDVKTPQSIKASVAPPALTAVATEAGKGICVEIPVEKLKVEPIVLKRVKSFSCEAVDSAEAAASKIDPHYTLISGLPDISAEEAESSSSSSSSSSSCSNASNSSSDDESSTSSSSAAGTSPTSQSVIQGNESKTPQKAHTSLSLENLSEISSTEDEEWQRLVVTEGENSQLVSNDGEVRYPVRSWLTPSKQQAELVKMATIRVTLPLKSAEKHKQRETATELEQKRERMKEKLRLDSQHKATSLSPANAPCISAALATTRKLQAMRDKPKRSGAMPPPLKPTAAASPEEKRTIDVLTALNLSAKKQPPAAGGVALTPAKLATSPPAVPSPGDIDDNAVSNIFVNAAEPETRATADNVPLKTLLSTAKAVPRKCLQIEARPAPGQSRATAKQKKIVRTPLDFKGSATTVLEVSSSAPTAAKVSPLPKIKITPSAGTTASGSNLRVSPRLNKGKKVTKRAVCCTDKRSKCSLPTKPKANNANPKKNTMETAAKAAHNVTKRIQSDAVTTAKADKKPQTKANNKIFSKAKPKCQEKKEVRNKTAISSATAAAVVEGVAVVDATALPIVPAVPGPVQNSTKQPTALVKGPEEDDDEEEDDNCKLVSISEVDANLCYDGPDDEPKEAPAKHDFSNFKMVVAIDEHERHTWQVTDEICLYTSSPQQVATVPAAATTQSIRNIPKKRKIRITTTSTSDETETARVVPTAPATTTVQAATAKEPEKESAAETAPQVSEQPVASSTPLIAKTDSSATIVKTPAPSSRRTKASVQRNKAANTKAIVENSSSSTFAAQSNVLTAKSTLPIWSSDTISTATKTITITTAKANANEAEKIQIEDIESILSHLHGT